MSQFGTAERESFESVQTVERESFESVQTVERESFESVRGFSNWDGALRKQHTLHIVSFISHRPGRKGTSASDLKGARAPPTPPCARHCVCVCVYYVR